MEGITPTPATDETTRPNGMTDEQFQALLALIERRKNDKGYLERGHAGVLEYRRKIQEELEREIADAERK